MQPLNDAIYDGFSFKDNGLVLTNIGHLTLAPRENQIERRANRSGGVLVQSDYGVKPINLEGYYIGTSNADAQAMYDTIAQAMNRQERTLVLPHAGGTRNYTATPESVVLQEPDGLNRLIFSINFVVPEGSSTTDIDTVLVPPTVISNSTSTIPVTVLGSVKGRPLFQLTFTSVSGGSGATVSIRNARDFIGLTITRNWATGDILTINSDTMQMFINGVLTAPVGRFPAFEPGSGSVYYSDTFTSRSVTLSATYKQRNL